MSYDYKKKRSFNQGWHSIDKVTQGIFRPLVKKKGAAATTLLVDWHLIVGQFLAEQTYPSSLYFDKGKKSQGSLKLLIKTSFSHEFSFHKQTIIDKVNAYFGYNVVKNLRIQQVYYLPVKKRDENPYGRKEEFSQLRKSEKFQSIYKDLSDIEDDILRKSLAELGFFLQETE